MFKHSSVLIIFFQKQDVMRSGYTATLVACGWVGEVLEKVTKASGQEPYARKTQKLRKRKKGTN